MNRFTAAILLICLSLQCFMQLGIVGWYELNKASITQKFCINKDKPQLHCNGKCHLKKQLEQQDKTQNKDQEKKQTDWVLFIIPNPAHQLSAISLRNTDHISLYSNHYHFRQLKRVFHPPPASA